MTMDPVSARALQNNQTFSDAPGDSTRLQNIICVSFETKACDVAPEAPRHALRHSETQNRLRSSHVGLAGQNNKTRLGMAQQRLQALGDPKRPSDVTLLSDKLMERDKTAESLESPAGTCHSTTASGRLFVLSPDKGNRPGPKMARKRSLALGNRKRSQGATFLSYGIQNQRGSELSPELPSVIRRPQSVSDCLFSV